MPLLARLPGPNHAALPQHGQWQAQVPCAARRQRGVPHHSSCQNMLPVLWKMGWSNRAAGSMAGVASLSRNMAWPGGGGRQGGTVSQGGRGRGDARGVGVRAWPAHVSVAPVATSGKGAHVLVGRGVQHESLELPAAGQGGRKETRERIRKYQSKLRIRISRRAAADHQATLRP